MTSSKEYDEKAAIDYLRSTGAPESVLDQPGHLMVGVAAKLMGIQATFDIIKVCPNYFSGSEEETGLLERLKLGISKENLDLSSSICANMRAVILNLCVDVKKLDIIGYNSSILFCTRFVGNAALPLIPFMHQLSEINLKKWEANSSNSNQCHSPDITCSNVLWLLLEIRCLRKASFYASFDDEDAKYLLDHLEITYWKGSWVKSLELDITTSLRMPKESVSAGIECILRYTTSVNSISIKAERTGGLTLVLDDRSLRGLTRSFDKVKSLSILTNVRFVRDDSTFNRLFSFSNLEYFSVGRQALLSLASPLLHQSDLEGSDSNSIPILPPSLKEIRLIFKPTKASQGELADSLPEQTLAEVIQFHPEPSKLKSVVVVSLGDEGVKDSSGRKSLEDVCRKASIKLMMVDRDE